ncbi:hypothetical protein OAU60_02355 [Euryarchaeota archaeon]|nr:hypothetical protein [Euryarchaeota archaeon]
MGFFADLWESFQPHTPSERLPNYDPRDYPYRDPNRKLTKRMEIKYNHLIARLGPVSSIDEGIEKLDKFIRPEHPHHSRNFFTHPFVRETLKLEYSEKYQGRPPVRDPHRKLTKRMEISYNQLLAKLGPISSIDEGIKKLDSMKYFSKHPNHSRNFLTHPYIKKALNFHDSPELVKEPVNEWWKVGKSENKSEIPWSDDKSEIPWSSIPVSESVDICGDPSCSTGVNAFDFRCFTCRKRYCDTHNGTGIDCKSCESLS